MPDQRRVLVTGANGRLGSFIVNELREHDFAVVPVDRTSGIASNNDTVIVDLSDFASVDVLFASHAVDAVVHVAGLPGRTQVPGGKIFANNMLTSHSVFKAARRHGVRHLVFASSETILGLPFDEAPPYLPVDEAVPNRFTSDYGLVKDIEERMAELMAEWHPEMTIVGLILATVITPDAYEQFRDFGTQSESRRYNLWSYVDVRDVAQAARLALGFDKPGFERFIVAANETVLDRPSMELAREAFGSITMTRDVRQNETLLSVEKAKELLGYKPVYSWRSELQN